MKLQILLHGVSKMSTESVHCFPSEAHILSMEANGYEFQIDGRTVSAQTVINIGNGSQDAVQEQEPVQEPVRKAKREPVAKPSDTAQTPAEPEKKQRTKKKTAAEVNEEMGIKPLF